MHYFQGKTNPCPKLAKFSSQKTFPVDHPKLFSKALAVQDDIARLHEVAVQCISPDVRFPQRWYVLGSLYSMYFILWLDELFMICMKFVFFWKKVSPVDFSTFPGFQLFLFGKNGCHRGKCCISPRQALTGLSGDFFEHKRLTQQVQSKLSSQVSRSLNQQVKQTTPNRILWHQRERETGFFIWDDDEDNFFPMLVVQNKCVFLFLFWCFDNENEPSQ